MEGAGHEEFIQINLAEISTRSEYRDWSGNLLNPERTSREERRVLIYVQNLQPKISLTYKMHRDKGGVETEGTVNQWLAQIETYPIWENQPLTLLMTFYCACWQKPSITVSWDASSSTRGRQMQTPTPKNKAELRKSCWRVVDKIEQDREANDSTKII